MKIATRITAVVLAAAVLFVLPQKHSHKEPRKWKI